VLCSGESESARTGFTRCMSYVSAEETRPRRFMHVSGIVRLVFLQGLNEIHLSASNCLDRTNTLAFVTYRHRCS
jgi:hypothetical protein